MIAALRGPNLTTPPRAETWEARCRSMFLRPRVTEVMAELGAVGASPLELFAVAVLSTPEEAFGTAAGSQADIDTGIGAATAKRDSLFALIGTSWTASDIDAGSYAQGTTSAARFRGTPVLVPPTDSVSQRK